MNMREMRTFGAEELRVRLKENRQELFNLRFQHATAQLENTSNLKAARKTIARIMTALAEDGKKSRAS